MMAGNVIERILRMRDEASPALRGVATEAKATASAVDGVSTSTMGLDERARKLAQGLGQGGMVGDLEDLAGAFKGVEASTLAAGAGFAAGTVAALGLGKALHDLGVAGSESLKALEELGRTDIVTQEQIDSVRAVEASTAQLSATYDALVVTLTDAVAPAIIYVNNSLSGLALGTAYLVDKLRDLLGYLRELGSVSISRTIESTGIGAALVGSGLMSGPAAALDTSIPAGLGNYVSGADTFVGPTGYIADQGPQLPAGGRPSGGRGGGGAPFDYSGAGVGNAATAGGQRSAAQAAQAAGIASAQAARASADLAANLMGLAQSAQLAGMASAGAARAMQIAARDAAAAASRDARASAVASGIGTAGNALGGVEGIAAIAGGFGPQGQAVAAALQIADAIRDNPEALAESLRDVVSLGPEFLAALPKAIGAAVPELVAGFVIAMPQIALGFLTILPRVSAAIWQGLAQVPSLIAKGISDWWAKVWADIRAMFRVGGGRNRDDRPERERGRGPASMPGRQDRDEARRQRVTLGSLGLGLSTARGV